MLSLERFSVELSRPLETARGTIDARDGFLVFVSPDGQQGVGEATPLPGWTESLAECRKALESAREVAHERGLEAALDQTDPPAARHGLALALADARASAKGIPLYRGLDARDCVGSVPVNATLGDAPRKQTVREARSALADGFRSLKLKVGARNLSEDVDRLRAVREAVGPDVELRADANGAWTRSQASEALDAFADVGLSYVEQPLPADDIGGHASLKGGPVEIALDESLSSHSIETVLTQEAANVVVLKPMVLGGPDRAHSVARRATDAGLGTIVSTTVDAVVARTGAVHLAASLPAVQASGLATAGMLADDISPDPAPVTDGAISVPQGKGLGLPERPET